MRMRVSVSLHIALALTKTDDDWTRTNMALVGLLVRALPLLVLFSFPCFGE